jgi:hypothetical protein
MRLFQNLTLQKNLELDRNGVSGSNLPDSRESSGAREIASFAERKAIGAWEAKLIIITVVRDKINAPFAAISSARDNARSIAGVPFSDT